MAEQRRVLPAALTAVQRNTGVPATPEEKPKGADASFLSNSFADVQADNHVVKNTEQVIDDTLLLEALNERERQQAENDLIERRRHGLSEAQWSALSDNARSQLRSMPVPEDRTPTPPKIDLGGSQNPSVTDELDYFKNLIGPEDSSTWTELWDPPGPDGIVRGKSRIARKQVLAKIKKGFTERPAGKVLPPPTIPCKMGSVYGGECGKLFYNERELQSHQQVKHPSEWTGAVAQRTEETQRLQMEMLRNQNEMLKEQLQLLKSRT